MTTPMVDEIIAKMRADIPVLNAVSEEHLNIYAKNSGFDSKVIYIEVDGMVLEFDMDKIHTWRNIGNAPISMEISPVK